MTRLGLGIALALGTLAGAGAQAPTFAQAPLRPAAPFGPGPGVPGYYPPNRGFRVPGPVFDPYRRPYYQEPRAAVVRELYISYLRREPAFGEMSHWTSRPIATVRSEMMRSLLSSDEYMNLQGGTLDGYIAGLYRDVLNRRPTFREVDGWARTYQAYTDRQQFVADFLNVARQELTAPVAPFVP